MAKGVIRNFMQMHDEHSLFAAMLTVFRLFAAPRVKRVPQPLSSVEE
jgi:hypothetical protein